MSDKKHKVEIKKINGYLKEVITFFDDSGRPINHIVNPLMIELRLRDAAQIFIGALLVASPLCFTEEVWQLSQTLPLLNILMICGCSFVTVLAFVYFNFYRFKLRGNVIEMTKRMFAIYFISTFSVVLVLFLINKFPVIIDPMIAFKRVILIGFPSIFGAAITDYLK